MSATDAPAAAQAGQARVLLVDDRTDKLLAMEAILAPMG